MLFLTFMPKHKTQIRLASVRAPAPGFFNFEPFYGAEEAKDETLVFFILQHKNISCFEKTPKHTNEAISAQVGCCPEADSCHFKSTQDGKINSLHLGNWDISLFCFTGNREVVSFASLTSQAHLSTATRNVAALVDVETTTTTSTTTTRRAKNYSRTFPRSKLFKTFMFTQLLFRSWLVSTSLPLPSSLSLSLSLFLSLSLWAPSHALPFYLSIFLSSSCFDCVS